MITNQTPTTFFSCLQTILNCANNKISNRGLLPIVGLVIESHGLSIKAVDIFLITLDITLFFDLSGNDKRNRVLSSLTRIVLKLFKILKNTIKIQIVLIRIFHIAFEILYNIS